MEQLVFPELVDVQVSVDDWQDAVKKAGALLVKGGYVEERYIAAMIHKVEDYGSYIVIAPQIAMPHARPEDGVNKTAIAVITLAKDICFGHPKNDPVKLVIALAASDNEMHLQALMVLMELLGDESALDTILHSKTPRELYKYITEGKEG